MKRYTIFFLLFVCLHSAAFGQQKITLRAERKPVAEVLKQIETQTDYRFSYNPDLLKDFPPVSLQVSEAPVETVLERLFAKTNVQFIVRGNYIILKKRPKNITISGYVYDSQSRESLIGANIYDAASQRGAVSNNFGFYSLSVPPGAIALRVSYVGYNSENIALTAEKDTVMRFFLQPSSLLQEVVIEGKQIAPLHHVETGKITLSAQTLQALPSFLGEKDVIKSLQLMPGVAAGTEGVAGMYVRGGNLDENLYLVDGNPLYHVNHLGGIFSTFNPEAVKNMDFYKGSFPARYGGRLSSVVDVRMNDGDMKKFGGTVSVGLISSRVNFQGPIVKDKTSFTVSLRRTYADLIARPILYYAGKKYQKENPEDYEKPDLGYYFYDFNAKINHKFSDRSRLYLSIYDGKDKLFLNLDTKSTHSYHLTGSYDPQNPPFNTHREINESKTNFDMGWGTRMASLNWTYSVSSKLFSNATLVYSRYSSDISAVIDSKKKLTVKENNTDAGITTNQKTYNKATYGSGIEDIGYRLEFEYTPVNKHYIRFGTSLLHHNFNPEQSGIFSLQEDNTEKRNDSVIFANDRIKVKELSFYVEDEIDLGRRLRMNAGVHFSGFFVQGKSYLSAQPRVSARYLLSDNWSLKASYGKMNQYVHLLQSSYISLPNDLWVPITKNIKPMVSHQFSGGVFGRLRGFDLSFEGYYKTSNNQVEYKEGANLLISNLNWEERVTQGLGTAYGMEVMARKSFGNTSGWAGYTLSWAERQFPNGEINKGNPYPAKYDNRHKINVAVMHKFNKKFDVSASWIYATGNWTTLPAQKYMDEGEQSYIGRRNNFKMPAYHRLDLSFNYYRHKKNGRMGIWNVSIYNTYSRQNSFLVMPGYEEIQKPNSYGGYAKSNEKPVFKSLSIFPIIPSFSYTYKF